MAARLGQLAALLLDFREQARVLDRQDGLLGERHEEPDGAVRKEARLLAPDDERAYDPVGRSSGTMTSPR